MCVYVSVCLCVCVCLSVCVFVRGTALLRGRGSVRRFPLCTGQPTIALYVRQHFGNTYDYVTPVFWFVVRCRAGFAFRVQRCAVPWPRVGAAASAAIPGASCASQGRSGYGRLAVVVGCGVCLVTEAGSFRCCLLQVRGSCSVLASNRGPPRSQFAPQGAVEGMGGVQRLPCFCVVFFGSGFSGGLRFGASTSQLLRGVASVWF